MVLKRTQQSALGFPRTLTRLSSGNPGRQLTWPMARRRFPTPWRGPLSGSRVARGWRIEFGILGPLVVRREAGPVALGGGKPRALLAMLLLRPNEPVSPERLAAGLWGEDAPHGSVKTVQVHVSRLRKALGDPELLTTAPAGYRMRVREGELDAERFERLIERGRRELAAGHADRAAGMLSRGPRAVAWAAARRAGMGSVRPR